MPPSSLQNCIEKLRKIASVLHQTDSSQAVGLEQCLAQLTEVQEHYQETATELDRLQSLFNTTFQFIGLMSPDGILVEVNQTALDFGGFSASEVINRPFWEAPWWSLSQETQNKLREAIAIASLGETVRYEVDLVGANNRIVTIDFSIKPVRNKAGQVIWLIPEGRDITIYKQAAAEQRAALQDVESQLQLAQIAANAGIWDWDIVTNRLTWSAQTYQLYQLDPATFKPTNWNWLNCVHPDDRDRVMLEGSRAMLDGEFDIEYRILAQEEVRWIHDKRKVLYDQTGQPTRVIGICVDITLHKEAEQERIQLLAELDRKQQLLAGILEQLPVGVVVLETHTGKTLLQNQQVQWILQPNERPAEQGIMEGLEFLKVEGVAYTMKELPIVRSLTKIGRAHV